MLTDYLRKVRSFIACKYHQNVRVHGEKAMDNLMGTMIGVLFLAVISASFAGIFMAYSVSSAKSTENIERTNLVTKHSTNSLNNLYAEANMGKTAATSAGWTVRSHLKALSATTGMNPSTTFAAYTYAATRPMVAGGSVLISQWGKNEAGLVTMYTSVPKAGIKAICNWSATTTVLNSNCVTVIDTISSVVLPPTAAEDVPAVDWRCEIDNSKSFYYNGAIVPLTKASTDTEIDAVYDVKTTKLGEFDVKSHTFNWVMMLDNLTPGKRVSIEFMEMDSEERRVHRQSFVATANEDETGNLRRSIQTSVGLNPDTTKVAVFIDTDTANTTTSTDPTIKLEHFIIYNKLAPSEVTAARTADTC